MDSAIRQAFRYFQETKDFSALSLKECHQLGRWIGRYLRNEVWNGTFSFSPKCKVYDLAWNRNHPPKEEDFFYIKSCKYYHPGKNLSNPERVILEYRNEKVEQLTFIGASGVEFKGQAGGIYITLQYWPDSVLENPVLERIPGHLDFHWRLRPNMPEILKTVIEARIQRENGMKKLAAKRDKE